LCYVSILIKKIKYFILKLQLLLLRSIFLCFGFFLHSFFFPFFFFYLLTSRYRHIYSNVVLSSKSSLNVSIFGHIWLFSMDYTLLFERYWPLFTPFKLFSIIFTVTKKNILGHFGPKSMNYSPWFWSVLGHFRTVKKHMIEERLVEIIDFTPPQKLGFTTFDMV
jgi:hypothetical protein